MSRYTQARGRKAEPEPEPDRVVVALERPHLEPRTATGLTPSASAAIRVALGVSARAFAERVDLRVRDVFAAEAGDREPACGWAAWERALDELVGEWLAADGRQWQQIFPAPCETWRLRQAATVGGAW